MSKSKFYNFMSTSKKHELYVYGEIVGGSDKWDESDVIFEDFRNKLDEMEDNSTLDIFVNSPGGSVFVTQGIVASLRRAKERGIKINAYIDGIGASCASWFPMVADNVYIYPQSILMIHKPMSIAFGNSNQMKKEIEILDKIEDDVIVPLYMERAKEGVTVDFIKEKMDAETWFNATEISNIFNVTLLPEERNITCCADKNVLDRYKNVPSELLNKLKEVGNMDKDQENITTEVEETEVESNTEVENVENEESTEQVESVESEEATQVEESTEEVEIETTETEEVVETEVEGSGETEVQDDKDVEIEGLKNTISQLESEKAELENKLNAANEKVMSLNDKVLELQPIVDEYKEKLAKEEEAENSKLLNQKKEYYKNKFEQLGARAKFESEEVQNLVNNCIKDEKAMSKLNLMVVDLISVETTKPKERFEMTSNMDNLLEIKEDITSKYGFK